VFYLKFDFFSTDFSQIQGLKCPYGAKKGYSRTNVSFESTNAIHPKSCYSPKVLVLARSVSEIAEIRSVFNAHNSTVLKFNPANFENVKEKQLTNILPGQVGGFLL